VEYRHVNFLEGVVVHLDKHEFDGCVFNGCRIIYSGENQLRVKGCLFTNTCQWIFAGPAQNVLDFLATMSGSGPEPKELVERLIKVIRSGSAPEAGIVPKIQ
jgi:hypothetical protein